MTSGLIRFLAITLLISKKHVLKEGNNPLTINTNTLNRYVVNYCMSVIDYSSTTNITKLTLSSTSVYLFS